MKLKTVVLFAAPFLTAGAEAFVEYLIQSGSAFDRATLVHALGAAVLVDLALLKARLASAPSAPSEAK